jgi:hypothetical protein
MRSRADDCGIVNRNGKAVCSVHGVELIPDNSAQDLNFVPEPAHRGNEALDLSDVGEKADGPVAIKQSVSDSRESKCLHAAC